MDVFISYSSKDRPLIREVCELLKRNGISYWVDFENDHYGDTFASEIVSQIKNAKQVLLFITESSNRSKHVLREIHCADKYKIPILPVLVGEVALSADFEYYLSDLHFLSYSSSPSFKEQLLHRLRTTQRTPVKEETPTTLRAEDYRPKKKGLSKTAWIVISAAFALLLVIGFFLGNSGGRNEQKDPGGTPLPGTDESIMAETETQTLHPPAPETLPDTLPETQTPPSSEQSDPTQEQGVNEIPEQYAQQLASFDGQSGIFLRLYTLQVKAGETVTPMAAGTWGDCTIYSENTAVAVGDGNSVRGVAPGSTHVLVESSTGSVQIYLVQVS